MAKGHRYKAGEEPGAPRNRGRQRWRQGRGGRGGSRTDTAANENRNERADRVARSQHDK